MKILKLTDIKKIVPTLDLIGLAEHAFCDYSRGNAVIPPVGELVFDDPPGDVHIKYGYSKTSDYYVIKIGSGFYQNPQINLPSSNGMMLVFNQKTGEPCGVLQDEGFLTTLRTAAAGALVAKYYAPKKVKKIGIVGTGEQAEFQLRLLADVIQCREVIVWGRSVDSLQRFKQKLADTNFIIKTTTRMMDVAEQCHLIVTSTPSIRPLLDIAMIQAGTHITAVGSDTDKKQELASNILQHADIIVTDSVEQAQTRGEIFHALQAGDLQIDQVIELGTALEQQRFRQNDQQITVADLTGIATQDITISEAVFVNGQ